MALVESHHERRSVWLSFGYFFALMAAWYILRPLRDEAAVAGGTRTLPWLFTAVFATSLILIPVYSAVVARVPRPRLIPFLNLFFAAVLLVFFVLWTLDIEKIWTARVYYVWTSVYALFGVSVFWSFMTDLWSPSQGQRLFGFMAAGGSLGSIAGSLLVLILAGIGAANLVLVAAALLVASAIMAAQLARAARDPAAAPAPPIGGASFDGFVSAVTSPYLGGIVVQTFLFTVTSTFLYFLQQHLISGWGTSESRTRFFSAEDLIVNVLAALVQAGLTSRLLARLGVGGALALTPALTALGFAALALVTPTLWPVAAFFVLRRILHFAVDRPAKELLFTAASRADRYKTKSLIDTVVYRGGDQIGVLLYPLLAALALPLAIPLSLGWLAVNLALARGFDARTHQGATT